MAKTDSPNPRRPALRPPPVLFPPPSRETGHGSPAPEPPLLGRLRAPPGAAGPPGVERYLVILDSLLPDPEAALSRLIEAQRADGAHLAAHWRLSAKSVGDGAHEVRFEPARDAKGDRGFLASGTFGPVRVEISVGLAHANPSEAEGFAKALSKGDAFRVIVLSHEVDPA